MMYYACMHVCMYENGGSTWWGRCHWNRGGACLFPKNFDTKSIHNCHVRWGITCFDLFAVTRNWIKHPDTSDTVLGYHKISVWALASALKKVSYIATSQWAYEWCRKTTNSEDIHGYTTSVRVSENQLSLDIVFNHLSSPAFQLIALACIDQLKKDVVIPGWRPCCWVNPT